MVVPDASIDPRFKDNPLVKEDPQIKFYAGAPLVTENGEFLGTLCVIDRQPRSSLTPEEIEILEDLAASVMIEIESVETRQRLDDITLINEELRHRMGNMYAHVSALVALIGRNEDDKDKLVRRLRSKIAVLGQTQALLAEENWTKISLARLIAATIDPFKTNENLTTVSVQQELDVPISSRGAFILTLALNELATNAMKYGALGPRGGQIAITWRTEPDFELIWMETSDKSIEVEIGQGFGTEILTRIVPMDMQGKAETVFSENGFSYRVTGRPERVIFSS